MSPEDLNINTPEDIPKVTRRLKHKDPWRHIRSHLQTCN